MAAKARWVLKPLIQGPRQGFGCIVSREGWPAEEGVWRLPQAMGLLGAWRHGSRPGLPGLRTLLPTAAAWALGRRLRAAQEAG